MTNVTLKPHNTQSSMNADRTTPTGTPHTPSTADKAVMVETDLGTVDLHKLHRVNLEAYARKLGMQGPFDGYDTRGALIGAIVAFRESK